MLFDRQAREAVEPELAKDETLLWFSSPLPLRLALSAYPFLLFGICSSTVSACLTVQWIEGPMSHPVTSAPADTIGMGLTLLVFWIITIAALSVPVAAYLSALATTYAITSTRILIVRRGRPAQSFEWTIIKQAACRVFKDSSGELTMTVRRFPVNTEENLVIKLIGIPRVRAVQKLLISRSVMTGSPTQASLIAR